MDRTYYDSFVKKLQEIFMMDHAELDFGIYRIMNYKRKEINEFLTRKLLPQVEMILRDNVKVDHTELKKQIEEAVNECVENGFDPNKSKKVKELKDKLSSTADINDLQNIVFSRLTQFFSRYYQGGDFISQRRYKGNGDSTYMIPYNGEEVKLCWANSEQYYIKTSEYFKNYIFLLPKGKRKVHFVLKEASTEQNDNKNLNGMERRFDLWNDGQDTEPIAEVDGELEIYFTYRLMPKSTKQKDLNAKTFNTLKPLLLDSKFTDYQELLTPAVRTDQSQMDCTWLEKHLQDYTAKNTFDYFIHKDLGGFLRRELDFYIKNEVLVLKDLSSDKMASLLAVIKAIEEVGNKIITFLAQLEDFQKKLWLKKKFVIGCDYCITLDRIPKSMYPAICANEEQRQEWVRLFAIDEIESDLTHAGYSEPLTVNFLEQNPFLVLDTKFFSAEFKHKLLASMDNIDGQCNGLLINSDNFQGLELLKLRFYRSINGIYIDPPYNTNASEILYKNGYKNSSWTSMVFDRIADSSYFLKKGGIICVTIDDFQLHELYYVLNEIFGGNNRLGTVVIKSNPSGRSTTAGFSIAHEYGLFYTNDISVSQIGRLDRNGIQLARYKERDNKGNFEWVNFRARYSTDSPSLQYPIFIKKDGSDFRIPESKLSNGKYILEESPRSDEKAIYPCDLHGRLRSWKWSKETVKRNKETELEVRLDQSKSYSIFAKSRMKDGGMLPLTWWNKSVYSATSQGNNLLLNILGDNKFSYPKSLYAVKDSLRIESTKNDALFLDFFAGSGTTGHAVIDLNREDNGTRKYILMEMGEYFNSATKPRIEKVIYSKDWKDGKPVSREGISQCFKYIRLEQYEDTLNNLIVKDSMLSAQDDEKFNESYMLGYLLEADTKGSLLNLQMFRRPFDVKIKTTQDNVLVDTSVDMVETFNYLIGLNVETESWCEDGNICVVKGVTHIEKEHTLVIWRNCDVIDNDALNKFFCDELKNLFSKQNFKTLDTEFDVIYVNGDNTLPNMRRDEEHWKVVMIEQEFKTRMFVEK